VPVETLAVAAREFEGLLCLNLAPVQDLPDSLLERADLVVVNELEATHYGERLHRTGGFVAMTHGAKGAILLRGAGVVAEAVPPPVVPIDSTGAGDAFTAALTLALAEEQEPHAALDFACTAAALSTTRRGAQPSMPWRKEVEALMANKQP